MKPADEVIPAAGTSAQGINAPIQIKTYIKIYLTVKELSAPVTKKNFNAMVLETCILDGKWNRSEAAIVAIIKKDGRFKLVAEEKLAGYKNNAVNSFMRGLKKFKESQDNEFALEQRRREALWNSTASNLNHFKETFHIAKGDH